MASPTTNKGYQYAAHGGSVGSWDTQLNLNIEYQDLNLGGLYPITLTSTTTAVTFASSFVTVPSTATSITFSASLAQNLFYAITGPSSQNLTINMPAAGAFYFFRNDSSGTATMSVGPIAGTATQIPTVGNSILVMTSSQARLIPNAFQSITTASISNSGTLSTGIITQTSSQYEQMASGDTAARPGAPAAGMIRYNTTLSGMEYWNGTSSSWVILGQAPTVQRFTSGTAQTYTPTTGTTRIRVRMCGGGGGGSARVTNNGSAGTNTSFGSWTAIHGNGGTVDAGAGGAGGTGGATGTGTLINRVDGASGLAGNGSASANASYPGGVGGVNPFGGNGCGTVFNVAGGAARANTGAGGQGGGSNGNNAGGGGGAGEYVEFWVNNPAATTYTVGAGGNGGAAGTTAGGNGAAGVIIIEEFYS